MLSYKCSFWSGAPSEWAIIDFPRGVGRTLRVRRLPVFLGRVRVEFEMSLPLNIDDLIHQRKVESARIEYKKDWNPEKVLHSVCAFANDIDNWGGGYIILGVEEKNGMPVLPPKGIRKESVDAVNKELLNVCNLIEGRLCPRCFA